MDPNKQPYQYPVDYLNQIAPESKKTGVSRNLKWIIIILGGATLVVAILMILSLLNSRPDNHQQLAARLTQTASIADDAKKNIKSSQLRSYNSNLTIYLTNTNRSMTEHLTATGVNTKQLDESIVKAETAQADEISSDLEDARLNAIYDRTYSREMAFQLETILALLQSAYNDTNNTKYREFLKSSYEDLVPIQKQIATFNEAST